MGLLGSIISGQTRVQFIQNNNTVIQLDCSMKETHSRESPASEFPIENGDVISDHIIVKPFALEITGIISDSPIGGVGGLLTEVATSLTSKLVPKLGVVALGGAVALLGALSKSKSPSVQAYLQLIKLQESAKPFDVLTSLYRYPTMWIKSLSAPRSVDTGKSLEFTVQLTQLLLVSPQSVNVSIFANSALSANRGDLGQQGLGILNGFQQGLNNATSLIKKVSPHGLAGGPT